MVSTFTTKITDTRHRIVIPTTTWELEQLQTGEYLEVTIKKIKVGN